ncbi:hypothetical protein CON88_28385, partial [Bacillus toyonensis]
KFLKSKPIFINYFQDHFLLYFTIIFYTGQSIYLFRNFPTCKLMFHIKVFHSKTSRSLPFKTILIKDF